MAATKFVKLERADGGACYIHPDHVLAIEGAEEATDKAPVLNPPAGVIVHLAGGSAVRCAGTLADVRKKLGIPE